MRVLKPGSRPLIAFGIMWVLVAALLVTVAAIYRRPFLPTLEGLGYLAAVFAAILGSIFLQKIVVGEDRIALCFPLGFKRCVDFKDIARSRRRTLAEPVGKSPRGVAASPDGTKVYVANLYDDTVSVVDTGGNTVLTTCTAADGAYDVAVSPDGRQLFVSNSFDDSVSVIPLVDGMPTGAAQPAGVSLLAAASLPEDASWGTVILAGFPAGGLVTVDREFPRKMEWTAIGPAVSFPAGTRTLELSYPDIPMRAATVTVGPGETVTMDGQMNLLP